MVRTQTTSGSTTSPRQFSFYFNGLRIGDIGNNGTDNVDYATAIAANGTAAGSGPFRGGATSGTAFADFDANYAAINTASAPEAGSDARYTVRAGDTFASIAQSVWGDASLWYMLAEANGLSATSSLSAGQSLILPVKVTNLHNNATTFKPYDAGKAIGDVQPGAPVPPKPKGNNCGILGQILLIVIAVAVTIATHGAAAHLAGSILGAGASTTATAVLGGALSAVAGSVASQAVGVATGIQDSFSFKGIALAAISGGIGGGVGAISGLSKATSLIGKIEQGFARGVIGNALTQGVSIATGLQSKFDWAGVAVGGVVGGVTAGVGKLLNVKSLETNRSVGNIAGNALTGAAAALAGAATRSLITGTDFGDNIAATLPDVIGSTIGNLVAGSVAGKGAATAGRNTPTASAPTDIRYNAETRAYALANRRFNGSVQYGGGESFQPVSATNNVVEGLTIVVTARKWSLLDEVRYDGTLVAMKITNAINLAGRESVNDIKSLYSDFIRPYAVSVERFLNRIDPINRSLEYFDYQNSAAAYRGAKGAAPRFLVSTVEGVGSLGGGIVNGLTSTAAAFAKDPRGTIRAGAIAVDNFLINDQQSGFGGRLIDSVTGGVSRTYGDITSGNPVRIERGVSSAGVAALNVASIVAPVGLAARAGNVGTVVAITDVAKVGRYGTTAQRLALSNRVAEAGSLSEAKGIVFATREANRLGYDLVDASLAYRGRQGIDLVAQSRATGDYAVFEAKGGLSQTSLSALRTYGGLTQGTEAYNLSRIARYLRNGDGSNDALALALGSQSRSATGLDSFVSLYGSKTTYQLPSFGSAVRPATVR